MINKSVYELENLNITLKPENSEDDPPMFIISPDLPDWVSMLTKKVYVSKRVKVYEIEVVNHISQNRDLKGDSEKS